MRAPRPAEIRAAGEQQVKQDWQLATYENPRGTQPAKRERYLSKPHRVGTRRTRSGA